MNDNQMVRTFSIPRGLPDLAPIELDMTLFDEADRRMHEVRMVTNATKTELGGLFNQACNMMTKYLGYLEYELLRAKKQHEWNRSVVILEEAPDYAKSKGLKLNEDIREALICQNAACSKSLDILNHLEAAKVMFTGLFWSYKRACDSVDTNAATRDQAPIPKLNGHIGQLSDSPQPNFMGKKDGGFNG